MTDGKNYALVCEDHGLALAPAGVAQARMGLRVEQFTGADDQLWTVTPLGQGKNCVATKTGGFCLSGRAGNIVLSAPGDDPAARWSFAVTKPEIYISGTHPLNYLADPTHAADWAYVRAHAAGLYTSNVRLHSSFIKGRTATSPR